MPRAEKCCPVASWQVAQAPADVALAHQSCGLLDRML
jgi:hypothetical protein